MTRTLIVDSDTARERESLRNAKEPAAEQKFIVFRTRAHMPPTKEKAAPPPRGRGGRGRPPIQGPAKRHLTEEHKRFERYPSPNLPKERGSSRGGGVRPAVGRRPGPGTMGAGSFRIRHTARLTGGPDTTLAAGGRACSQPPSRTVVGP